MKTLSDRQKNILAFLRERIAADGYPPTQLEIARAFGFQRNSTVIYHLLALEAAGEITRPHGAARSIRVLRRGPRPSGEHLKLPILGRVAAGSPIGNDINSEEYVVLERSLFSSAPDYLLRVKGHSMRDDAILDGDLVAIRAAAFLIIKAVGKNVIRFNSAYVARASLWTRLALYVNRNQIAECIPTIDCGVDHRTLIDRKRNQIAVEFLH